MEKNKEVMVKEQGYMAKNVNLSEVFAEEMDGLTPSFDRIKIPSGGGISYEVPGEDMNNPDSVKEFNGVILYHHPICSYYAEKYSGGNTPPDCGSMDGHIGIVAETGEVKQCVDCPNNKFGSGESGGKACKSKRRLYVLRENEALPTLLTLPTGSLSEFSKYVMRLLSKGKKTNSVVTKFSLKKAQNSGGINYSQAVLAVARDLKAEELGGIEKMTEQVKTLAGHIAVIAEE